MKRITYLILIFSMMLSVSCTGWFDNIPPYEATEDMLDGDNVVIGAFFPQLQRNVISTHNNQFQLSQNLVGDLYSGYMATPTNFGQETYNLVRTDWLNNPFEKVFAQEMSAWMEVNRRTGGDVESDVFQLAQIIRIASMSRFTDNWGPIPYSQVGSGSIRTAYDSQADVYDQFFKELDKAIEVLYTFTIQNPGAKPLSEYDLVYGGDYSKWVKFANSMRLRLAMRIAYVDPVRAQAEAEKAIADPAGLILENADNASVKSLGANDVINQLYTMWSNYQDIRMGASMWSVLTGYNDPRLEKMWQKGEVNGVEGYHALRIGVQFSGAKDLRLGYSSPNVMSDDPIVWMNAAEVAFLKAEGALRGWNMGTDAKSAYETGVKLSFEQWGASGVDAYLADAEKVPADYKDPLVSSNNTAAVSTINIAWNDSDKDKSLERIITQKWIALFPNGHEAWTEYRRTGYPYLFKVLVNNSSNTIDSDIQIRRMPYPPSEKTVNEENLKKAIELLGGPDNGGTRLWWDVADKSIK